MTHCMTNHSIYWYVNGVIEVNCPLREVLGDFTTHSFPQILNYVGLSDISRALFSWLLSILEHHHHLSTSVKSS